MKDMSFITKEFSASVENFDFYGELIDALANHQLFPLITEAKKKYFESLGIEKTVKEISQELVSTDETTNRLYRSRSKYTPYGITSLAGDIFPLGDSTNYLYLLITKREAQYYRTKEPEAEIPELEIGFFGDEDKVEALEEFKEIIDETLNSKNLTLDWNETDKVNYKFTSLLKNKEITFHPASDYISDFKLAE